MAANGKFQDYCLKWNNYYNHLSGAFLHLLESESMVDVTLSAGGEKIRAHRIVLSASSPYFQELLESAEDSHPTLILSDVNAEDMKAVLEFVYRGELCVMANRFASVLKVADNLKIRGLSEVSSRLPGLEEMINTDQMADNIPSNTSIPSDSSVANDSNLPNKNLNNNSTEAVEEYNMANQEVAGVKRTKECIADAADDIAQRERCEKEAIEIKEFEGENIASTEGAVIGMGLERDESPLKEQMMGASAGVGPKTNAKEPKSTLRTAPRYVERCEGIIEITPRKRLRKQCYRKEYSEENLCEALAELRRGRPLIEAAAAHHIPRSTLYVRARSSGIQLSLTRQEYTGEMVSAAVQAVQGGSSLKRASEHFKIPKTVLWRKVQRELESGNLEYKKLDKSSRSPYTTEQRQAAFDALLRGENISKVYRDYQIPKTTLFRERSRLVACGRIPRGVKRDVMMKRGGVSQEKLDLAVTACQKRGMTHALAALTFQVPKTTLWRRLQQLRKETMQEEGMQGDEVEVEENMMGEEIKKDITKQEGVEKGGSSKREVKVTAVEDKVSKERMQVQDSLEVVVEREMTMKEDGTVSFVAAEGSSECPEGLQFPPGSSLIILAAGESLQLQEGSQIIVETDET